MFIGIINYKRVFMKDDWTYKNNSCFLSLYLSFWYL